MFAKRVIVAYNDTDLSNDVLDYVHNILKLDKEIKLDIIYSYEEPVNLHSPFSQNFDASSVEMEEFAKSIIEKGESRFTDLPNEVQGFICKDGPANSILDHAHRSGADLIVIGNRGFSGLREFVSSVSRTVQSKAKIPVLVFPKFDSEMDEEPI